MTRDMLGEGEVNVLVTSIVEPPDVIGNGLDDMAGADKTRQSSESIIAEAGNGATSDGTSTTVVYVTATTSGLGLMTAGALSSLLSQTDNTFSSNSAGLPSSPTQEVSATWEGSASSLPTPTLTVPDQTSNLRYLPSTSTTPGPVSERTSHVPVAPIVGAIVPIMSIILFFILFCCWYRKKRIRDRQLDDLERTAVWVNGIPDAGSTAADTIHAQNTKKRAVEGMERETEEEDHGNGRKDHSNQNQAMDEGTRARAATAYAYRTQADKHTKEQCNPFEASPIEDSESIRSSQIGLAITTSMDLRHSPASSTATVIKHVTYSVQDPFVSDPEELDSPEPCASPIFEDPISSNADITKNETSSKTIQGCQRTMHNEDLDGSDMLRSSTETVIYSPSKVPQQR